MKLRKLAAALTAAAIAATSAVVCPISAVAADSVTVWSGTQTLIDYNDSVTEGVHDAYLDGVANFNKTNLDSFEYLTFTVQLPQSVIDDLYTHYTNDEGKDATNQWKAQKSLLLKVQANDKYTSAWGEVEVDYAAFDAYATTVGTDPFTISLKTSVIKEKLEAASFDADQHFNKLRLAAGWLPLITVSKIEFTEPIIDYTVVNQLTGTIDENGVYNIDLTKTLDKYPVGTKIDINYDCSASPSGSYPGAQFSLNAGEATNWGYQVDQRNLTQGESGKYTLDLSEILGKFSTEYPTIPVSNITQFRINSWDNTTFSGVDIRVPTDLIVNEYNVTVEEADNGTVTADKTAAAKDDTVTLTVSPATGYTFDVTNWTIAPSGVTLTAAADPANTYTFSMPENDVTITPAFTAIDYTITECTDANGNKVTAGEKANYKDEITLTVTPKTGYKLDGNVIVTDASGQPVTVTDNKFTMPASNVTITAKFVAIEAESVAIDATAAVLTSKTKTLAATVTPDDALDQTVTWASDAPDVATVSETGVVTGVKAGTANITATTKNGKVSNKCVVTVTDEAVPCTGIKVEPTTAEVEVGKTAVLKATAEPADTTDEIKWSTSDEKIATVANGTVTGVAVGEATITATCGDKTATCKVTVKAATKPCTKVTLDKTTAELKPTETVTLTATTDPKDTTDKLTWSTSDAKVATVVDGKVTAVAAGTATITATCGTQTATCAVTVKAEEQKPAEPDKPAQPATGAIWEGTNKLGTGWDSKEALVIDKSRFADVKAGDTLKITFAVGTADYHQIQVCDGKWSWKGLSSATDAHPEYGSIGVTGTTYEFVLSATDVELLKTTGMVLFGYDVTYTKVESVKSTGENLKPNGNTAAEDPNSAEAKKVPAAEKTAVAADTAITSTNVATSDAATKTVSQKSASTAGKYTQRFFMLLDEADVTKYDAVRIRISVTDSNGTVNGVFKTKKYYKSITVGGTKIEAPEGKVFIAFALKNIPDGATVNYSEITLQNRG